MQMYHIYKQPHAQYVDAFISQARDKKHMLHIKISPRVSGRKNQLISQIE